MVDKLKRQELIQLEYQYIQFVLKYSISLIKRHNIVYDDGTVLLNADLN